MGSPDGENNNGIVTWSGVDGLTVAGHTTKFSEQGFQFNLLLLKIVFREIRINPIPFLLFCRCSCLRAFNLQDKLMFSNHCVVHKSF